MQCSSLFVIDLDAATDLAQRALEVVGANCNCVASTRKGVHLYFRGAVPDLRGKQLHGLDIRTGDGKAVADKNPDIIFCAPSHYDTPAGNAVYEWVVLPEAGAPLLAPPAALLDLLRSAAGKAGPAHKATSKAHAKKTDHAAAPPDSSVPRPPSPSHVPPVPPSASDLVLPELFVSEKRPRGSPRLFDPQPRKEDFDTIVFVDGGARPNPGPASAAIVIYDLRAGTVRQHSRYLHHATNNFCESLALLGGARCALGRTLIIGDSELAQNQATGAFKIHEPTLEPFALATRTILQKRGAEITLAHMHGHHGKVPNHADPLCTYTVQTAASLGVLDILAFEFTAAQLSSVTSHADWLPTNVSTLTSDQLQAAWENIAVGDCFSIWWSLATAPLEIIAWTGEKLDPKRVRYTSDTGTTIQSFPPAENVRTHKFQVQYAQTRRRKEHGTRLKHNAPNTTVEMTVPETVEMFRSMSSESWVKWCMATPTRRSLPTSHWYAWSSVVRRFLVDCNQSSGDSNFADGTLLLLGLPQLYLDSRVRVGPQKEHLERHVAHRRLPGAAPKHSEALDVDDKAIRQAQNHASQGFIAKACKALGKNRVLDADSPHVMECLEKKHPAPLSDFLMHDPPLVTPPYLGDDVASVLKKCANGSAPGWSGWTKELLSAACKADPLLFHELGIFLARLQSCSDPRLLDIVRVGKLIALDNAKVPGDPEDPRPITISELFSKLLGLLSMKKSSWQLHECQRGVCHKGGTHQCIVEAQLAYDTQLHKTVATFDVSNAFNATMREAIRMKLHSLGPSAFHLLDYFRWMYGSTSNIFIRAKDEVRMYLSRVGVRQGDMPASLLFSLVFTDAAVAAGAIFEDVLHSMWLYLDDVTIVASVDEIIRYKVLLAQELAHLGLSLNMKKCRVLVDRLTDADIVRLAEAGFQLDRGCTRVLGSPVGDPTACRLFVLAKVGNWQTFWERIRDEHLHPSIALVILAKCGNVKFEHLAKSLPPEVVMDAARMFDQTVESTARVIIAARPSQILPHVLRAVLHLRPYTVISPVLYTNTLQLLQGIRTDSRIAVHDAIVKHYETLPPIPFVEPLIRAVQGVTAADTIVPALSMSPADFAHGLRLRCGVAPAHLPHTCSCGYAFTSVPAPIPTIAHLLTCPHNVGNNMTTRHHGGVFGIKNVLFLYGLHSIWENCRLDPFLRPDLHIISLRRQVIIDFTVVNDVYANDAEALRTAAEEKHAKYDELAERLNMRLFAVPVSAFGRLHDETVSFIHHLAKEVNQYRRADFVRDMKVAIQHAILLGNAQTVDACHARINDKAGNWLQ